LSAERTRSDVGRAVFGTLVLAFGVLLFLRGAHVPAAEAVLQWIFPIGFVALGVSRIIRPGCAGRTFWGWLFVAIGAWLAARRLGFALPEDLMDFLVPAALIIAGVGLVRRSFSPATPVLDTGGAGPGDAEDRVSYTAVLAGEKIRRTSSRFAGGSLAAVFGGCSLDLTGAGTSSGGAHLEVTAFCGGVTVRVPEGWEVRSRVTPVLGGFEDKTRRPPGADATGLLFVEGNAVLGGVEIIN